MKKKFPPLAISILIHLSLVLVFLVYYMDFSTQKNSFIEKKISIQLNDMPLSSPDIKKIKPKPIIEKENLIVVDENKVLPNAITKQIKKSENKKPTKDTVSIEKTKEYIDNHKNLIAQLLKENLYYPRSARKRGITGAVIVKFFLSKNSLVHSIQILSSKSDILSRGAIKTITNLSGKFPAPKDDITLIVPIKYSLK